MTKSVGGTGAVPSQILGQYLDKFRDDTAVVPPTYGRDRSQTSDSFGCPRSARCTDNCILNRLHERPEGDSGEFGIARAAGRRMARAARMWQVGRYVIMPDHIHLFCAPAKSETQPLLQWVKYWKSSAARNWIESADSPVWQRHFWDTQLRRSESYDQKWQYVVENPVRAGLVARSEDWRYQGEMNVLQW